MKLKELCNMISLPNEMTEKVMLAAHYLDSDEINCFYEKLKNVSEWKKALENMKQNIGEDNDGSKILSVMLLCALQTYNEYCRMGISERVFSDTMKFCTRFVKEHYDIYGVYSFTWAWWFPRQLSMREFRIGSFEYEMICDNEKKLINIHIPADADMSIEAMKKSYEDARAFFKTYFPEYTKADMVCCSWLLSPVLDKMLPLNSNIRNFRKSFDIIEVYSNSNEGIRWLYSREDLLLEDLPENTSLQKKMKKYLLEGNCTGSGYGVLNHTYYK